MENTKHGELQGTDNEHPASGKVALGDGVLKLQDTNITEAPDARVILTAGFDEATGIRIGALKNFTGTDEYQIPVGTDLSQIDSIIVWCDQFSVPIAKSKLS